MTQTQKHQQIYGFIRDRISCGWEHVAAVLDDGTVRAYGDNKAQQCNVSDWTDVVKVKCGPRLTVGLKKDGTVLATPDDTISNGSEGVANFRDVIDIGCGISHVVGLKSDGTAVACGSNSFGQCNVQDWNNIKCIYAENTHTIALCHDGSLLFCGYNMNGALNLDGMHHVKQLYCGAFHTFIVTDDNQVYRTDKNSETPVPINIRGNDIAQVSFGTDSCAILKSSGTVLPFGIMASERDDVPGWKNVLHINCLGNGAVGIFPDGAYRAGINGTSILNAEGLVYTLENDILVIFVQKNGKVTIYDSRKDQEATEEDKRFILFKVIPSPPFQSDKSKHSANGENKDAPTHKTGIAWEHYQKYGYLKKRVSGGFGHTVAIMAEGTAKACGVDLDGQCQVDDWNNLREITCGNTSTFGLRNDGKWYYTGKLMPNEGSECEGTPLSEWPEKLASISACCGTGDHVLGLTEDGHVLAYGNNDVGQCSVDDWHDIVEIKALFGLSLGVTRDGQVVCCGNQHIIDAVSQWSDIEHVYGFGVEFVVGLRTDGRVLTASNRVRLETMFDTSQWEDVIYVSCAIDYIAGIRGDGHVYFAGQVPDDLIFSGLDNILDINLSADFVVAPTANDTIWVGLPGRTLNEKKNAFKVVTSGAGFMTMLLIDHCGRLDVFFRFDHFKRGQDQTQCWFLFTTTTANNDSDVKSTSNTTTQAAPSQSSSGSCYVATCVYGSYDCPEVWTLRRFRDNTLASSWYGRAFIHTYYAISPTIVKWFGSTSRFKSFWRRRLDRLVTRLQDRGVASTPYNDQSW